MNNAESAKFAPRSSGRRSCTLLGLVKTVFVLIVTGYVSVMGLFVLLWLV